MVFGERRHLFAYYYYKPGVYKINQAFGDHPGLPEKSRHPSPVKTTL
jgi:hypothetical protein